MSGTLAPGTRIYRPRIMANWPRHDYYRGLVEGGALGTALGLLLGACLTALAWSHMG